MGKIVKPQLHSSHIGLLYQCGERFRRSVLDGEREPRSTALAVGSATHESVFDDLTSKADGGELLPEEAVKDNARDSLLRLWDESPMSFDKDERSAGIPAVKGAAVDQSIALSVIHHQEIAPSIIPRVFKDGRYGLEWKWVIEAEGFPYDLSGTVDVIDANCGIAIRDTKTAKAKPSQLMVDKSEQLSLYAMAYKIIEGVLPDKVWIDALVKTKTASSVSLESTRTEGDFLVVRARFQRAIEIIEAGIFAPASPTDFLCSEKFCGFYKTCRFTNGNRPMSVSVSGKKTTKKGVKKNGGSKIIKTGSKEWYAAIK